MRDQLEWVKRTEWVLFAPFQEGEFIIEPELAKDGVTYLSNEFVLRFTDKYGTEHTRETYPSIAIAKQVAGRLRPKLEVRLNPSKNLPPLIGPPRR